MLIRLIFVQNGAAETSGTVANAAASDGRRVRKLAAGVDNLQSMGESVSRTKDIERCQ
jgi:hypothetical protein